MNRRRLLKTVPLGIVGLALNPEPAVAQVGESGASKPSRMRLGTVTYNLARDWDLETIIQRCEETEFEGVELRTTHAHGVEVELNAGEREEVKKRFRDSKVDLMGLGSAFDFHTPDPEKLRRDIEATKRYIVLAHDVGAEGVKVRPNGLPENVPVEKTLEQIGRALREIAEFGDGYGVEIRLEVHGRGTSLLPNVRRIMDAADHANAGVCWNCNPTDLEGAGFDRNFEMVKEKINAVHMRDLYLESYPFRTLFARLNAMNYGGYCLAEIPESSDPVRVMKYYRGLWLALQDRL